jgi:nitroimidazol reductase NimA-like FMN-containing flavoprotein (pyridoxamine 5'-phosphate oxidase superfamily)
MTAPDRPMRRRDRELEESEARAILDKAEWGVLATVDGDGWPYAVPVNHALIDGALIVHCATAGHKLDNLAADSRVSYCVVTQSEVLPLELSTRYESAIAFGRAALVCDEAAKREALRALGERFASQHPDLVRAEIEKDLFRTTVVKITLARVTGKARR